jgi:hypothetical protein
MTNSTYPTLLNKRARILANLNRAELALLASVYLILSYLGVGGIPALLINIVILVFIKIISGRLSSGFMEHITSPKQLNWSMALGGLNES